MLVRLWRWLRDPNIVAFATPEVRRLFIACRQCRRIQPHYRAYPPPGSKAYDRGGQCSCGHTEFAPVRIPEWRAAWWVLAVGWLWRKTIRGETNWDPRMPHRVMTGNYVRF
jgi:hypothetical protein